MKSSLNIKLGFLSATIICLTWYGLSRSLSYYAVASVSRYCLTLTLLLLFIGIFISVFFQKKENKGFIPFKAALRTGVVYAIIVALGLAIFNFIYYKYIAPDAIEYYVSEAKNQIVEAMKNRPTDKQLTAEDIRRFEEHIRSLFGSFTMFGTTFLEGLIISLIVAGILQKKEPKMPFSEN